jgi:hypothetical protein
MYGLAPRVKKELPEEVADAFKHTLWAFRKRSDEEPPSKRCLHPMLATLLAILFDDL